MLASVASVLRARSVVLGLFTVAGLLAVLSLRDTAHADPYPTDPCQVTGNRAVQTSGEVQLTGSGFPANTTVALRTNTGAVAKVRSDGDGSFQAAVAVPAGQRIVTAAAGSKICTPPTPPTDPGNGPDTGPVPPVIDVHHDSDPQSPNHSETKDKLIQRVNVIADPAANSSTASTGFAATSATAIALILLVGGVAFVFLGRRRDSA